MRTNEPIHVSDETPWRAKAHRLIYSLSKASFLAVNTKPDGTLYAKHRPYSVPADAEFLCKCLADNNEQGAKDFFLSYDGMKLIATP